MRCFHPLSAWKTDSGEVIFHDRNGRDRELQLRCGQCIGCRISRSQDWAVRCVNEKALYDSSVFLTLTWDDEKMRAIGRSTPISLDHRPFQLFIKRLRKSREVLHVDVEAWAAGARKYRYLTRPRMSYFMCGEYGENFSRPHYHALVFGVEFPDRKLFKTNPMPLYRSAELERLWPFGYSSFGDVTLESAQYVAGYVVGRRTGPGAEDHYKRVNLATGEVVEVSPEYGKMSLRPGIGTRFFDKFNTDVTVRDSVVVNGREFKPPKYYDRRLREKIDGFLADDIEFRRYKTAIALEADNTEDRLRVAETVVRSRLALKRRILE